jgi:hypothetical protein
MSAPLFEYGQVAYLVESAGVGSLEAVHIGRVEQRANGWVYAIAETRPQPTPTFPTFGDRITSRSHYIREYNENELTDKCGALTIIKDHLERRLVEVDLALQSCQ